MIENVKIGKIWVGVCPKLRSKMVFMKMLLAPGPPSPGFSFRCEGYGLRI